MDTSLRKIGMWRSFMLAGLTAVLALGLIACGTDDTTDDDEIENVPDVEVTPLQPESEGTPVPRPQEPTGTIPSPTPEGPTPATSGEVTDVIIGDDLVVEDMTIAPGDSVRWTNEDDVPHTIASTDEGDWGGVEPVFAELAPGESVTNQFTLPGEYPLTLEGEDVTWTVTVE